MDKRVSLLVAAWLPLLALAPVAGCSSADEAGAAAGGAGQGGATASGGAGGSSSCAGAAPCSGAGVAVVGVDGPLAHGSTVTLCGCGFGTKSPVAPILYDDFESGAAGEIVSGPRWSTGSSTPGNEPRYSSAEVRAAAGQSQSAFQSFVGAYNSSLTVSDLAGLDELYFHGWYRATPSGAPTRNTKLLLLVGTQDFGAPAVRFFDMYYPDSPDAAGHNQFDPCSGEYQGDPEDDAWHDASLHPNEWVRMEGFVHLGTTGQRDGHVWLQRRGDDFVDRGPESPQALLRNDGCDYDRLHIWSYHADDEGSPTPGLELYWDEVYVDSTQARVELGNAATRSSSTHFEIQIPSAWSDTYVDIRVNRGTLPPGQQAYVYVVDRDGNANESGYPVTVEP